MNRYTEEEAKIRYLEFFKANPPAVILAKGLEAPQSMVDAAKQTGIPLLTTTENTSTFISSLILFLNTELAPRLTRHGVLMEVYGEGMLIMGDSGVGKSETAVELIKRGHRLVADDAVELRKITAQRISGTSPDNIRHFLELRGIGIINARRIFGMGAIKSSVDVDLIVNLELWDDNKVYDRMGMEDHYTDILGVPGAVHHHSGKAWTEYRRHSGSCSHELPRKEAGLQRSPRTAAAAGYDGYRYQLGYLLITIGNDRLPVSVRTGRSTGSFSVGRQAALGEIWSILRNSHSWTAG